MFKYIIYVLLFFFVSCKPQLLFESEAYHELPDKDQFEVKEHIIAPDDKLSLSVWNHNDLSIGSIYNIYNSNEVYGKWVLVNPKGYASLPKMGPMKLGGLTIQQATDSITTRLSEFIVDPVVVLKVLNRELTVMGEVKNQGSYNLEKEVNYLTDIIAKAGGYSDYADMERVTILRRNDSTLVEYRIDLTDLHQVNSRNLSVYANDVIYIPPRNRKVFDKQTQSLVAISSIVASLVLAVSIFR